MSSLLDSENDCVALTRVARLTSCYDHQSPPTAAEKCTCSEYTNSGFDSNSTDSNTSSPKNTLKQHHINSLDAARSVLDRARKLSTHSNIYTLPVPDHHHGGLELYGDTIDHKFLPVKPVYTPAPGDGFEPSVQAAHGDQQGAMEIRWKDMSYTVPQKWYQKVLNPGGSPYQILTAVTGRVRTRQLTALMGPSGSGKSTLLECLMGIKSHGLEGVFEVYGHHGRRGKRGIQVSCVPQKDEYYPRFTVTETVMFASRLKNPHYSTAQHVTIVQGVIAQLDLTSCANTRVLKCSGGQQKRLSIACELVSRPDVLLLDEPTSGLDVATCMTTVNLLSNIAHNNPTPMAIVVSIHQPSSHIFSMFDHVYILAQGGICAYEGPPDSVPGVCETVMGRQLKKYVNPADTIIEIASGGHGPHMLTSLIAYQRRVHEAESFILAANPSADLQAHQDLHQSKLNLIHQSSSDSIISIASGGDHHTKRKVKTDNLLNPRRAVPVFPFWTHIGVHLARSWAAILRDPILMGLRLGAHVFIPILTGLLFGPYIGGIDGCPLPHILTMELSELLEITKDRAGIQTALLQLFQNFAFVYVMIFQIVLVTVGIFCLSFPMEAKILRKEYRNSWYSSGSYFIGRSLAELPFQIFFTTCYTVISYYGTGQIHSWDRLMGFVTILILITSIAQSQGLIAGAVFMDHSIAAVFIGACMTVPFALFSNFFVRLASMPHWVRPLTLQSYFFYGFNGIISLLYGFGRCVCDLEDTGDAITDQTDLPYWARHLDKLFDTYIDFGIGEEGSGTGSGNDTTYGMSAWSRDLGDGQLASSPLKTVLDTVSFHGLWAQNCTDYRPIPYTEFNVSEVDFYQSLYILIVYGFAARALTYVVLRYKIAKHT